MIAAAIILAAAWIVWLYPFLFRAPHGQKRASVTRVTPTRIGLLLETGAIGLACAIHYPVEDPLPWWRLAAAMPFILGACWLAFSAVKHLGKQFRVTAGLYEDHELVRTGAYAVVRHPIYAGLLAMLIATIIVATPWQWGAVSLVVFLAGTEIRVRTEDALLASRFPQEFEAYRRSVRAYIPFVR